MHIVDGVLSPQVLLVGTTAAAGGVAVGLRRLQPDDIPRVGLLSAVFFVASLVHVPVGPASIHLVLLGLMGVLVGWASFPALLVGLLMQAVMFGYGGITVLGVNTLNMALPAVLCSHIFGPLLRRSGPQLSVVLGFLAGVVAVSLSGFMVAMALALSGEAFTLAAKATVAAHVPLMLVEGVVTAAAIGLLRRVSPSALSRGTPPAAP